jgi:ligand-binding SRPBCC domain-containing protein
MRIITSELSIPLPREKVFPFFADARNLEAITPPWLKFRILTPMPLKMEAGALIDYQIKLRGIPLNWRTQITVWDPPYVFADCQLRGPYTSWVHVHTFEERDGKTLVKDCVHYSVFGGALVDKLFVKRDVDIIFKYRTEKLAEIFGLTKTGPR